MQFNQNIILYNRIKAKMLKPIRADEKINQNHFLGYGCFM